MIYIMYFKSQVEGNYFIYDFTTFLFVFVKASLG